MQIGIRSHRGEAIRTRGDFILRDRRLSEQPGRSSEGDRYSSEQSRSSFAKIVIRPNDRGGYLNGWGAHPNKLERHLKQKGGDFSAKFRKW